MRKHAKISSGAIGIASMYRFPFHLQQEQHSVYSVCSVVSKEIKQRQWNKAHHKNEIQKQQRRQWTIHTAVVAVVAAAATTKQTCICTFVVLEYIDDNVQSHTHTIHRTILWNHVEIRTYFRIET